MVQEITSDVKEQDGYVDIHCHILPDCDDGAQDLSDAVELAKMAYENGTRHIIATPHTWDGMYTNHRNHVLEQTQLLQAELERQGIALQVHPGNEIHIHTTFLDTLQAGETTTLADMGKYLLLELPFANVPSFLMELIYEIRLFGIVPIIAHPERYVEVRESPGIVFDWVQEGALTQVTSASLYGRFGDDSRKCVETLFQHGLSHLIASDGHNVRNRKPTLRRGYETLEQLVGTQKVADIQQAATSVLLGESIPASEPIRVKKKKFWIF